MEASVLTYETLIQFPGKIEKDLFHFIEMLREKKSLLLSSIKEVSLRQIVEHTKEIFSRSLILVTRS
jgi:hypothetical protein